MSRQAYMSLVCTSIRSAGAIGPACSTAMTCRACRGPTTSSKAASAIPVAACCGPRARRASPSARCNAKVPGSSYPGPQQRPSYWGPCVTLHLRTWLRKGSALLRIANGSACRADPFDRPKRNSITCVRGGRRDSLQAQGDFRGIASTYLVTVEQGDQLVGHAKLPTFQGWRYHGFNSFKLLRGISPEIDRGRLNIIMTQPQRHLSDIPRGLQHQHGTGVP